MADDPILCLIVPPDPPICFLIGSLTGTEDQSVKAYNLITNRFSGAVHKAFHHADSSPRNLPRLWSHIRLGEEDQKPISQRKQEFVDQGQHGQRSKQLKYASLAL